MKNPRKCKTCEKIKKGEDFSHRWINFTQHVSSEEFKFKLFLKNLNWKKTDAWKFSQVSLEVCKTVFKLFVSKTHWDSPRVSEINLENLVGNFEIFEKWTRKLRKHPVEKMRNIQVVWENDKSDSKFPQKAKMFAWWPTHVEVFFPN